MAALNCAQAFHDDAVRERLAHPAEPTNLLILGLGGAGKKSLLANIRAAATLTSPDALFATPSAPTPAADVDLFASPSGPGPTPAAAANPPNPRRLTVNNAHCAALTLGGETARARAHNRRRLDKYLRDGLAPAKKGGKGKVDGVLFVVDWEAWPAHDAARDELVALLERDGGGVLGGVPVAVFFNNVDYKGLDECGVMEWEMVVRVWREYLPAEGGVEVFMGSVEDQWGYLEAFTWLLGFCG